MNGNSAEANGFDEDGAKIGEILERARNELGLSLQEVEQATKIRKRYLAGLEQEDFGVLPDAVYVQGFLKTYANYLGLDGEELASELKRRRGRRRDQRQPGVGQIKKSGFDRPVLGPSGLSEAQGRRVSPATLLTLVISVVALVVVIGALYYVGRDTQTLNAPQPSEEVAPNQANDAESNDSGGDSEAGGSGNGESPESANESNAAGDSGGAEVASGAADDLEVTVNIEGADSWLSVSADGAVEYAQVAPPGFSQTFEARDDITLSTGNAGAVNVEVNGQNVGVLGDAGQVLDRTFTLKDAG